MLASEGGEAARSALAEADLVFASRLTLVEVERVLLRYAAAGDLSEAQAVECRRLLADVVPRWRVIALTDPICERAAQPFPVEPLRTLDALHLATALFAARFESPLTMLSTDDRIKENARRLGLQIAAI